MTALEAVSHPDFLVVRVDPEFGARYARVIHRVRDREHPTGRHCAFSGTHDEIMTALAAIRRSGEYTLGGQQ